MIGGNIDGSTSNQLFDLLTVMANPDVYSAKLKALEAATAENKKTIELVGKVDDILKLRKKAEDDAKAAADKLRAAADEASKTVAAANSQAKQVVDNARDLYEERSKELDVKFQQANALMEVAKASLSDADKQRKLADQLALEAKAAKEEVAAELAKATAYREEYQKLRNEIVLKHQAFISGL